MSPQGTLASAASPESGDGFKKKFPCTWPGCGKSFSRSEHLHRHALNHKDGNNTCLRCSAHFSRRDLLDRHMNRHKEKDDEAGGEGLGHLATRKRLWRDADGNIINSRRPHYQGIKRRQLSSEAESIVPGGNQQNHASKFQSTEPPPPTASIQGSEYRDFGGNGQIQGTWEAKMNPAPPEWTSSDSTNFLCNANWGVQQFQADGVSSSEVPYDNMSINAPFTTLSYYSWLFENDDSNTMDGGFVQIPSQSAAISLARNSSALSPGNLYYSMNDMHMQDGIQLGSLSSDTLVPSNVLNKDHAVPFQLLNLPNGQSPRQPNQCSSSTLVSKHETSGFSTQNSQLDRVPDNMGRKMPIVNYTPSTSSSSEHNEPSPTSTSKRGGTSASSNSDWSHSTRSSTLQISTPPDHSSIPRNSYPLPDAYITARISKYPQIGAQSRKRLLKIIDQYRPTRPNGLEINASDPFLSLFSLQRYSDLFFEYFNSAYPLIHQATFDSGKVHEYLLMSIILLGATYKDKEAHLLAVCIHDIMRPLIHSSKDFSTRPALWMLQTILLVECFGKSRAGEKQHEMSHLYHGLLINLIRKSDCQSAFVLPFDEQIHASLEDYWRLSIVAEQKRRLAMLCFMWDTQHAVLFSQSLCMNASELKITLPWDNAVWEAPDAEEWFLLSQKAASPPQYLAILRMYTNPCVTSPPYHLNALSRVLIFHGLMSISWDLNRRDQTSLSLSIINSSIPWRTRMAACYSRWMSDFESYTASVLNALSFDPGRHDGFQRFSIANMAVYHTAQLILDVNINDLQINAGARHIIGRPVTDSDRTKSKTKIEEWIAQDGGKSAGKAIWHAARIFRDGLRKLQNWDVNEMFHYPWCLYLATLMCWTFHEAAVRGPPWTQPKAAAGFAHDTSAHSASPTSPSSTVDPEPVLHSQFDYPEDEDSDWDSGVEMKALISALTKLDHTKESFVKEVWRVGATYKTQGLLRCMAKQLHTVRWAVVMEGMIVLRRLLH